MVSTLGDYWARHLKKNHREALYGALCIVTDDYLDDPSDSDASLIWSLPQRYNQRYNEGFARKFFVTFLTVAYKLAQPRPPQPLLSCTAEELALHVLIEQARAVLEMRGIEANFDAFEDLDHEFLYDPEMSAIADLPASILNFENWFEPSGNLTIPPHPYST